VIRFSLSIGPFYLFDLALFSPVGEPEVHELESSSNVAFGFAAEPEPYDDGLFEEVPEEMKRG
jgi:hypothetical protein